MNNTNSDKCCGGGACGRLPHQQWASQADDFGAAIPSAFGAFCTALEQQAQLSMPGSAHMLLFSDQSGVLVLGERFLAFRLVLGDTVGVRCTPTSRFPGIHSHARRAVPAFSIELFAGLMQGVRSPHSTLSDRNRFARVEGSLDDAQVFWRYACPTGEAPCNGQECAGKHLELSSAALAEKCVRLVLSAPVCPPDINAVRRALQA